MIIASHACIYAFCVWTEWPQRGFEHVHSYFQHLAKGLEDNQETYPVSRWQPHQRQHSKAVTLAALKACKDVCTLGLTKGY